MFIFTTLHKIPCPFMKKQQKQNFFKALAYCSSAQEFELISE